MSNTANNFASREVCDLIFYDYATDVPILFLDFANVTTYSLTGESVFAYGGKGHPKRVAFNGDRQGTMVVETQLTSMKLYNMITGGTLSTAAKFVKREELVAAEGGIELTDTPVTDSVMVYTYEDDCGEALEATVTGKKVTATEITDGKKYVAYYMVSKDTGVKAISIKASSFPKEVKVYGDTYGRGEDGFDHQMRMVVYKAAPQSNMELSFSNTGDPTTLSITFDLEADGDKNLITLIQED